jgi:hypothetical protein
LEISTLTSLKSFFFQSKKSVSAAPFIVLRMVFGTLMFLGTIRFLALGWVDDHYLKPIFHFHYFGLSWIEPLPAFWLYAVHYLMLVASLIFVSAS